MVIDVALSLAAGYWLTRWAATLAGPGPMRTFALATLLGIALLLAAGELLLALDVYSVTRLLLACAAIAALAGWAAGAGARVEAAAPPRDRHEPPQLALLGLLALVLAAPAYQVIAMGSDAGVYLNHAMQLEHDGRRFPDAGIDVARLPPALKARYLADNRSSAAVPAAVVEGLKVRPQDGRLEFHALPGWPVLLSVSGRLLGMQNAQYATVPILMALGCFVLLALRSLGARPLVATLVAASTMSLPIVVYFSRYPTVEIVLATTCLGMAWALLSGMRSAGLVAGLAFLAFALVHLSSFIPLLLACLAAPFACAALGAAGRRQASIFLAIAGAAQLLALAAAHLLSPGYASDLLSLSFGSYHRGLGAIAALAAAAIALATVLMPWGGARDAD